MLSPRTHPWTCDPEIRKPKPGSYHCSATLLLIIHGAGIKMQENHASTALLARINCQSSRKMVFTHFCFPNLLLMNLFVEFHLHIELQKQDSWEIYIYF